MIDDVNEIVAKVFSIPESEVQNQNDHPNLVSYNLPVGTYLVLLMDSTSCTRENHIIFDVKE